jgi:hypothetical protein
MTKGTKISLITAAGALAILAILLVLRHETDSAPSPPTIKWDNPNLLVNRERLEKIKASVKRGDPLTVAAFTDLVNTAEGMLHDTPNPISGDLKIPGFYTSEREIQQRLTRKLRADARKTHVLALANVMTGRREFADKSREILFAWVRSLKKPVDGGHWWEIFWLGNRGDTPLVIWYSFPAFIYAFDLLKGENALSPVEVDAFRAWLRPFVDYSRGETLYKNNNHNWQVAFLMCAAHALEDATLFDRAVHFYRNGIKGQIRSDGALSKELWRREKSGTYTLMALEAMVQAVHIAEQHGYTDLRELRSKNGGTLGTAIDFYLQYLKDPTGWTKYTNAKTLNTPKDIADWGFMLEVPYSWWHKDAYLPFMQKRPYGYGVERCYTLDFATLLFMQS